jgi:hypothetical protein
MREPSTLDLYWIPLGVGTSVVRLSGRTYEAGAAMRQQRSTRRLFHTALVAGTAAGPVTVEMAAVPAGSDRAAERGVVGSGAVGTRWLGRFRVFRYEIRRWANGTIPDLGAAVASPVRISDDPVVVDLALELVAEVPTPVWGRDELRTGEMWNSNSVVAWVLTRSGVVEAAGEPPAQGRAPGWAAGVTVARRARDERPGGDGTFGPVHASSIGRR